MLRQTRFQVVKRNRLLVEPSIATTGPSCPGYVTATRTVGTPPVARSRSIPRRSVLGGRLGDSARTTVSCVPSSPRRISVAATIPTDQGPVESVVPVHEQWIGHQGGSPTSYGGVGVGRTWVSVEDRAAGTYLLVYGQHREVLTPEGVRRRRRQSRCRRDERSDGRRPASPGRRAACVHTQTASTRSAEAACSWDWVWAFPYRIPRQGSPRSVSRSGSGSNGSMTPAAGWKHLWRSPDSPFTGRYWQLDGAGHLPPPAQPGGPPLWLAARDLR